MSPLNTSLRKLKAFVAFAGPVLAAYSMLAGCEAQAPRRVAAVQATSRPTLVISSERIKFPPAPIAALAAIAPGAPLVGSVLNIPKRMSYGDYVWKEDGVKPGKTWILVDLKAQTISAFRNGDEIGRAVTLFGVDGYPTPTGRFTVLSRAKTHVSSLYDAPMPYTLRLTRDGVSIHGSNVRKGVGTHGCVGVPMAFGAKLFEEMRVGDEVMIIADNNHGGPRGNTVTPQQG